MKCPKYEKYFLKILEIGQILNCPYENNSFNNI